MNPIQEVLFFKSSFYMNKKTEKQIAQFSWGDIYYCLPWFDETWFVIIWVSYINGMQYELGETLAKHQS